MNHKNCRCELLTSSEVGHVAICAGCGQIHLNLAYVTLRFDADAFRALTTMVNQAQRHMDCAATADASLLPAAMAGGLH